MIKIVVDSSSVFGKIEGTSRHSVDTINNKKDSIDMVFGLNNFYVAHYRPFLRLSIFFLHFCGLLKSMFMDTYGTYCK